jgi:BCD family chlorophyll transporter-like MFS transporter
MGRGALTGFALAARWLSRGSTPTAWAARHPCGLAAFSAVIFSNPWGSAELFFAGAGLIGFGGGLFSVATLTAAMTMPSCGQGGARPCAGRMGRGAGDGRGAFHRHRRRHARRGERTGRERRVWGEALANPATGYSVVYHLEILLLFITLVALGPLVRTATTNSNRATGKIGLADLPT